MFFETHINFLSGSPPLVPCALDLIDPLGPASQGRRLPGAPGEGRAPVLRIKTPEEGSTSWKEPASSFFFFWWGVLGTRPRFRGVEGGGEGGENGVVGNFWRRSVTPHRDGRVVLKWGGPEGSNVKPWPFRQAPSFTYDFSTILTCMCQQYAFRGTTLRPWLFGSLGLTGRFHVLPFVLWPWRMVSWGSLRSPTRMWTTLSSCDS